MMKIATASSLFQEKGLDKKGIFTLLVNAVDRENINRLYMSQSMVDCNNTLYSHSLCFNDCRTSAINFLTECVDEFSPNLDWAEQRISQFFSDHTKLRNIRAQIDAISIWDMLFKKRKKYKRLSRERLVIEDMSLSTNELLNIAFYHYHKATQNTATDFVTDLKFFLEMELKNL